MFSKDAKVKRLGEVPLFSECSKRQLAEIAAIADELHLPAGRTFIKEGASGREFVVVLDGTVEVTRNGRRLRQTGGPFFGEAALLTGAPRNASVTTTSPVQALVITERAFDRLLRDQPTIQRKVIAALGARAAVD